MIVQNVPFRPRPWQRTTGSLLGSGFDGPNPAHPQHPAVGGGREPLVARPEVRRRRVPPHRGAAGAGQQDQRPDQHRVTATRTVEHGLGGILPRSGHFRHQGRSTQPPGGACDPAANSPSRVVSSAKRDRPPPGDRPSAVRANPNRSPQTGECQAPSGEGVANPDRRRATEKRDSDRQTSPDRFKPPVGDGRRSAGSSRSGRMIQAFVGRGDGPNTQPGEDEVVECRWQEHLQEAMPRRPVREAPGLGPDVRGSPVSTGARRRRTFPFRQGRSWRA